MTIQEIVSEDVDWIHLSQDRLQSLAVFNTTMSLRVPRRKFHE
jgi:hypothetical protein